MSQFLLFESASGYGLFEVTKADELAQASAPAGWGPRPCGTGPGGVHAARQAPGPLPSSAGDRWRACRPAAAARGLAGRRRRRRLAAHGRTSERRLKCLPLNSPRSLAALQGVDAVQQAVSDIQRFGKSERPGVTPGAPPLWGHMPARTRRRRCLERACCARMPPCRHAAVPHRRCAHPAAANSLRRREAGCLQALHLGCQRAGADQRRVRVAGALPAPAARPALAPGRALKGLALETAAGWPPRARAAACCGGGAARRCLSRAKRAGSRTCAAALPPPLVGQVTDDLKNFLTTNLPKVKKEGKAKFKLGVAEAKLGSAIQVGMQPAAARAGSSCSRRRRLWQRQRRKAAAGAACLPRHGLWQLACLLSGAPTCLLLRTLRRRRAPPASAACLRRCMN